MKTIVVDAVHFAGTGGGAVFIGTCREGVRHRFVASFDVMPRPPVAGEVWRVSGSLQDHPVYGRQVVTTQAVLERPSGRLIRATLAKSDAFPGIGEKLADHLWRRFGEDLYGLLEAGDPAPFVGPLRSRELARALVAGWRELSELADAYQWLDRHGAPVWLAQKVAAIYGDDIVAKLEENPYRLQALAGWEPADRIARSMGVGLTDPRRLVAAADAAVMKRLGSKHTWGSEDEFRTMIRQLCGCSEQDAAEAVELALADQALVRTGEGLQGLGPAAMEEYIAQAVMAMATGDFQAPQATLRQEADVSFLAAFCAEFSARHCFPLNQAQREALAMALNAPVGILCGGAGVGKTTVLRAVCEAADRLGAGIIMLALSGRAARRMAEATGRQAFTIASFLIKVDKGEIGLGGEPTIAIDEASMLDLATTYRLLRRLEPGCRVLFLGDPGQLPPISFGVVFHTLVATAAVPLVELTEIHRQAAATGIPQAGAAIRAGAVPVFTPFAGPGAGIHFIDAPRAELPAKLEELVATLGGFEEVQILSPVKAGVGGTRETNRLFHGAVTGGLGQERFAIGEPVIWTRNDYELGLMNGSLGVVLQTLDDLVIDWDGEEKVIDNTADMEHAYAITIHKSQGSQFRRVIIPVFPCRILDRTMLYTAVTRAQEQVILVGDRQAFLRAVAAPPSTSVRQTGLQFALVKAGRR
jgi:exodeoxyribonuclease V alpha subunit